MISHCLCPADPTSASVLAAITIISYSTIFYHNTPKAINKLQNNKCTAHKILNKQYNAHNTDIVPCYNHMYGSDQT